MGWTDERVELLKKLWGDGLSCRQIAKQLGGITRNAVLGKIHRLGLSGRATPSKPARPARPAQPAKPRAPRPMDLRLAGNSTVFHGAEPRPPREVVPFRAETPGAATSLTLGRGMCKWPIGDPADEGFTHCGRHAATGPYCQEHALVAYQPAQAKKRSGAAELARSLRRYL